MTTHGFPQLDPDAITATRNALHAYSRVLGDWLKTSRVRRKHWWHASLRPSLTGLTTGVIHGDIDFEIEMDLRESALSVRTAMGERMWEELRGQPAEELATRVDRFLQAAGVSERPQGIAGDTEAPDVANDLSGYSPEEASKLARALNEVSAAMVSFRAGIREETSPIQVWPHHFDLSMIWLPGHKVPDQDPANEEYADKQMNFGFAFGDESINEPYFYVTAYPSPAALSKVELPAGSTWKSNGFNGAVLLYKDLLAMHDPATYLREFWSTLLSAGKIELATNR